MKDTVAEVDFFDRYSKPYLEWYEEKSGRGFSFQIRRDKVEAMIKGNHAGKKLLDIGAGPGVMVEAILRHGYDTTLADAAPHMLEEAKRQFAGNPKVSFVVADCRQMPSESKTYDVVTAMGLVEYLGEDHGFYKEMHRITKDDGTLIVTYPNYYAPWRFWNRLVLSVDRPLRKLLGKESTKDNKIRHKEYRSKDVFAAMVANGFMPKEIVYYNLRLIPHPLDDWFPRLTYYSTKLFEYLDETPLRWLGTAFIVRAVKVKKD